MNPPIRQPLIWQWNCDLYIAGGEATPAIITLALQPILIQTWNQPNSLSLLELQLLIVLSLKVIHGPTARWSLVRRQRCGCWWWTDKRREIEWNAAVAFRLGWFGQSWHRHFAFSVKAISWLVVWRVCKRALATHFHWAIAKAWLVVACAVLYSWTNLLFSKIKKDICQIWSVYTIVPF